MSSEKIEICCPHCHRVYRLALNQNKLAKFRKTVKCARCRKRFHLPSRLRDSVRVPAPGAPPNPGARRRLSSKPLMSTAPPRDSSNPPRAAGKNRPSALTAPDLSRYLRPQQVPSSREPETGAGAGRVFGARVPSSPPAQVDENRVATLPPVTGLTKGEPTKSAAALRQRQTAPEGLAPRPTTDSDVPVSSGKEPSVESTVGEEAPAVEPPPDSAQASPTKGAEETEVGSAEAEAQPPWLDEQLRAVKVTTRDWSSIPTGPAAIDSEAWISFADPGISGLEQELSEGTEALAWLLTIDSSIP